MLVLADLPVMDVVVLQQQERADKAQRPDESGGDASGV
jgi:hypothetical protein